MNMLKQLKMKIDFVVDTFSLTTVIGYVVLGVIVFVYALTLS